MRGVRRAKALQRSGVQWRGRVLVALTVAMTVCLATNVGVSASDGVRHSPLRRPRAQQRGGVPSRQDAELARLERKAARRKHWLESPKAQAQRNASRMAFRGLRTVAARELLERDFGSVLQAVSAVPTTSHIAPGHVTGYVNDYEAVVDGPEGQRFVNSTVPLAVLSGNGRRQPVDLHLKRTARGYASIRAAHDLSIARRFTSGVVLAPSGIRVAMEGQNVSGASMAGDGVFFGRVAPDTDAVTTPTISGVELFTMLRSRQSPQQLVYSFVLPPGARLRSVRGAVEVLRANRVLAKIPAPTAADAQGQNVPVTNTVVGNRLVLHVAHRRHDLAYPVLVDPSIDEEEGAPGWTYREGVWQEDEFLEEAEPFAPAGPGSISAPTGSSYVAEKAGKPVAQWIYQAPVPVGRVEWAASNFFLPDEYVTHEPFYAEIYTQCTDDTLMRGDGRGVLEAGCAEETETFPSTRQVVIEYVPHGEDTGTQEAGLLDVYALFASEPTREHRGSPEERYGSGNPGAPSLRPTCAGDPVNCATGNLAETQNDITVGGRGLGLNFTRTYNSQLAAAQSAPGPFGYGWTSAYSAHLAIGSGMVTVNQDDGSTVSFDKNLEGEFLPSEPWVQAKLVYEDGEYKYTLPDQTVLHFDGDGVLTSETDRNGNTTTLTYKERGKEEKEEEEEIHIDSVGRSFSFDLSGEEKPPLLESITDPSGRKITLAYNADELVESATDPAGNVVKYVYDDGNLTSVVEPGATDPRWQYEYDPSHQMTEMTDGREGTTKTSYGDSDKVASQTDPEGNKRKWEYGDSGESETYTILTEPNGAMTREQFNDASFLTQATHGYGTSEASTETLAYDAADGLTSITDGDEHVTKYTYDTAGDRTSKTEPEGQETKWGYDDKHDVTSITTPNGETTTIERDSDGNATSVSRPAPRDETQTTEYAYGPHGELESMTDPLDHTWTYGYDENGDRTRETDPEGNETTWTYDEDSRQSSTTKPRGNVEGADAAEYTTTIERDAEGRPVKVTEPEPATESSGEEGEPAAEPPSNTVSPAISGTLLVGQTLSSTAGTWAGSLPLAYGYQWQRCDVLGESCLDISGATHSSYVLDTDDVGSTLRVVVTASNSAGSISATSEASGVPSAPSEATYSSQFGSKGSEDGQFNRPGDVAIDSSGDLWVLDVRNDRVEEFNKAGEYLSQFGSEGSESGQFIEPVGIAVDSSGDLWVLDSGNERVQEFNREGEYLSQFGSEGIEPGQFEYPEGIAVDSHDDIWVSDTYHARLEEFNDKGEYLKTVVSGMLAEPEGLAVDSAGDIWVADWGNERIEEFDEAGEYVAQFGSEGEGDGQFEGPYGVAAGPGGRIWVGDLGDHRIEEFDKEGAYIDQFGAKGAEPGEFIFGMPMGLAIDAEGAIWIADTWNNRIDKWVSAAAPAKNATSPGISGMAVTGETLSANIGTWEDGELPTYTYQWQRCDEGGGEYEDIVGATEDSYALGESDVGTVIRVAVTATNLNGHTTAVSTPTAEVARATPPSNTTPPMISGQTTVGYALHADSGAWEGTPSPAYTYQWQRCDETGDECKDISGATSSMHVLTYPDGGGTLRVVVTATNTAGSASSSSAVTGEVAFAHARRYAYDADGQLESATDPYGNKTSYTYNADNEPIKVEEPDGTVVETKYDEDGQVVSQTNGAKHTTTYKRNSLGEVTEVTDPLGRKTIKEYDPVGNLKSLTDPEGRTATYTYYENNRLKGISYSDESTHGVEYEYNEDGDRTSMNDGTGTTSYEYDQLDRLTESKDGHGETTGYEYDLANEQIKIAYPNGEAVKRAYDKDGRLEEVEDWLGHATTFSYDPDSEQTATIFPSGTGEEDTYAYDVDGQMTGAAFAKGAETLASLGYSRGADGRLAHATAEGLPGESSEAYAYDENGRLGKAGGTAYEYDAANSPIATPGSANTYDDAGELEKGTGMSYSYDEVGERTKATPSSGPATSYGHDQAGNMTSVARPEEGEVPKIEDTYAYDGTGLRASQTVDGSTSYFSWDTSEALPLLLDDGTDSYINGPGGLPIEQINNSTEKVQYLHHDQAGSTRLITGSTGAVEGSYTYDAYGNTTGHTGTATTPLGYDAQLTSSDTGLIYLRARVYDPATAQFMSVDPMVGVTQARYTYAGDNPLNASDPTGLSNWNPFSEGFWTEGNVISEGPLNPIPYYEKEIESYESGCGYLASVAHGLEGAAAGAALVPEGLGSDLFLKFAERFPRTAALLLKQQAYQQVTQPGKVTIAKAVLEKLQHLLFGG